MTNHSCILKRPLQQELTQRGLVMDFILESLNELGDVKTQIGVIQERQLGDSKHSDSLVSELGVEKGQSILRFAVLSLV